VPCIPIQVSPIRATKSQPVRGGYTEVEFGEATEAAPHSPPPPACKPGEQPPGLQFSCNITGVTFVSSDIAAKRLQFLRDIAPNFTHLAVIWNPDHVDPEYREIQSAAKTLGIQIRSLEVRSTEDFDSALRTTGFRLLCQLPHD
jgi:hypothetical protein